MGSGRILTRLTGSTDFGSRTIDLVLSNSVRKGWTRPGPGKCARSIAFELQRPNLVYLGDGKICRGSITPATYTQVKVITVAHSDAGWSCAVWSCILYSSMSNGLS